MPCSTATNTTRPRQVTVSYENTGKDLIFVLTDEGNGLDPEKLPDPLAPENLLRGTGRGIFLIRSIMDEVHFRQLHPGTELTLVKHLTPASEDNLRHGEDGPMSPNAVLQIPRCCPAGAITLHSKKEEFPWLLLLLPVKWTA